MQKKIINFKNLKIKVNKKERGKKKKKKQKKEKPTDPQKVNIETEVYEK